MLNNNIHRRIAYRLRYNSSFSNETVMLSLRVTVILLDLHSSCSFVLFNPMLPDAEKMLIIVRVLCVLFWIDWTNILSNERIIKISGVQRKKSYINRSSEVVSLLVLSSSSSRAAWEVFLRGGLRRTAVAREPDYLDRGNNLKSCRRRDKRVYESERLQDGWLWYHIILIMYIILSQIRWNFIFHLICDKMIICTYVECS